MKTVASAAPDEPRVNRDTNEYSRAVGVVWLAAELPEAWLPETLAEVTGLPEDEPAASTPAERAEMRIPKSMMRIV